MTTKLAITHDSCHLNRTVDEATYIIIETPMHPSELQREFKPLLVSSPAFKDSTFIPKQSTCEGKNVSPPLDIGEVPEDVKSLTVVVDDPDAPHGTWVHWIVWNIPVTHHIKESDSPGIEGINDFGTSWYGGPCPPTGTHRYFFRVYGLDDVIQLKEGSVREQLNKAMRDHIVAYGELIGLYKMSK